MNGGSSYNGWPASDDRSAIGVDPDFAVAGVDFPGGVKSGDVAKVLGYVAQQIQDRVEPLVPGWCWGHNYRANANNPNNLSNHSSGTALDVNAPDHPNGGSRYGGFTDSQVAEIRRILDEVQGAVEWGADYSGTADPMHFDVKVSAGTLAGVAASLPEGADMGLTADDKDWIRQTVAAEVSDALTKDATVNTTDVASSPNAQNYTVTGALERLIRLEALDATGQPVKFHPA